MLFVLPEVFTLVLGPSFVSFLRAFPSLSYSHCHFGLLFPILPTSHNHLILCHPLLLPPSIFPSIRVFSNYLALRVRWPKYWSFSYGISSSNEYPGLISFRIDWFDLLAVQGTLKSLLQQHNSKASVLQSSAFFTVQLSLLVLVLVAQSCLTLFDPMDCSLPGSSDHGILQARVLEWVSTPSSRGSSQPRDQTQVSCTAGILYCLSHQRSPRILELVAYPFSRGTS